MKGDDDCTAEEKDEKLIIGCTIFPGSEGLTPSRGVIPF